MSRCLLVYVWYLLALVGCSSVAKAPLRKAPPPANAAPQVSAELHQSARLVNGHPMESLGYSLDVARQLEGKLAAGDRSTETRTSYNYAVARVVEGVDKANADPWSSPLQVASSTGNYTLRAKLAHPEPRLHPSLYRMIPTDTVEVGGAYFKEKVTQDGVGAPVAVVAKNEMKFRAVKHDLSESNVYGTATATLSFKGSNAELLLHEPLRTDTVSLDGRTYPLAADFSTPLALLLAHQRVERLGLVRLILPQRYADTARLTRLQLYDPETIPVLMVHGLDSTPATWTPMINQLRADPDIRKRYQFWVFSYPSGYPYPYSASLLRKELDKVNMLFPDHKPIVLMGHSMGGMISRLMLTDSGDAFWRAYFGKSPAETKIPGMYRKELDDTLIFSHRREIARTIFFSAPHRGATMALSKFGRLMARLIRTPSFLADVRDSIVNVVTADATAMTLERAPNSIDTLSTTNRFVIAVNKLPLAKDIPFHSVMGDRGKGGNKDHTKPVMSDGVVPYWSAHLDGAVSERIVPSGHSSHQNPEGIAEARRILRLHAGLPPAR